MKANNITPYNWGKSGNRRNGNPMEAEWKAATKKLASGWARLRLSNEDVETILKIAAKLP